MNYEKLYKEALERAKAFDLPEYKSIMESVFPELAEGGDEKIRNEILTYIGSKQDIDLNTHNKWCSWLEKQGEQAPIQNEKDENIRGAIIDHLKDYNLTEWAAWLEKQVNDKEQINLPHFTFDDVLALQCCMETVKKVQEDKDLYEKLKDLHGRVYDAYHLEKQGENTENNDWINQNESTDTCDSSVIKDKKFPAGEKRDFGYFSESDNKVEPKFHEGDIMRTLEEVKEGITNGLPVVVSIDEEYYHCNNELISIKDQDEYEYPPMNRKQKYADKLEPKFKVGDWVVTSYGKVNQVVSVDKDGDGFTLDDDTYFSGSWKDSYHLWSIQDAMDGDVLFQDLMCGKTFIYNGVNPDMAILYSFIISNDGKDVLPYHIGEPNTGIGNIEDNKNIIHPATKAQRALLFAKMHEAGYEWDEEKKELKKISQRMVSAEAKEALYDKPAWWGEEDGRKIGTLSAIIFDYAFHKDALDENNDLTGDYAELNDWLGELEERFNLQPKEEWGEEDDVMVRDILGCLPTKTRPEFNQRRVDWIKSLKGRVRSKQEWSEEDETMKESIIKILYGGGHYAYEPEISWLKSLKPQAKQVWSEEDEDMIRYIGNAITCKESAKYLEEKGIDMIKAHRWLESFKPQPKQVWGEEDERLFDSAVWHLRNSVNNGDCKHSAGQLEDWLESLKQRIGWKPSKKQVDALDEVYKTHGANSACRRVLITLLNDLKKLTE